MKARRFTTQERLAAIAVVLVLWICGVGTRLVHLQVYEHGWLEERAVRQQERTVEVSATRGRILDREGRELARSVERDSIYATVASVKDPAAVAHRLAPVLDVPEATLLERLSSTSRSFVCLKRKAEPEVSKAVEAMQLEGIELVGEMKRVYPGHALASQVLGYCGVDENGLAGIEQVFDKDIKGHEGRVVLSSDARRRTFDASEFAPTPGNDVVLTVDEVAQYRAEQALAEGVKQTGAHWGIAIVMRPKTGEIVALANYPTFDPNQFGEATDDERRNRAVEAVYEPGSVFKIVPYSGCIEENLITPDTMIDCQYGSITVANRVVHDEAYGVLPASKALAVSSNVAAIKMGLKLGNDRLYNYIRSFGFGERTGIELPGETAGLVQPLVRWQPTTIGSIPMGHEVGVTALQALSAMNAIANDGVWVRPHVVDHMVSPTGEVLGKQDVVARRVVSERTAAAMTGMLEGVVLDGTAKHAGLDAIRAAGKTGTAQKIEHGGYSQTKYVASFCGFAPADDPELSCIVVLDEPHNGGHTGGVTAAPIFGRILTDLLVDYATPGPVPADEIAAARQPGKGGADARGGGERTVLSTVTASPASAPADARPELDVVQSSYRDSGVIVPNLTGLGLRAAIQKGSECGLLVQADGSGRVAKQAPSPGAVVPPGTALTIVLSR